MKLHVYTTAFCYVQCDFNLAPNYSWSAGERVRETTQAHIIFEQDVCGMSIGKARKIIGSKRHAHAAICCAIGCVMRREIILHLVILVLTFLSLLFVSRWTYLRPSPSPFIARQLFHELSCACGARGFARTIHAVEPSLLDIATRCRRGENYCKAGDKRD